MSPNNNQMSGYKANCIKATANYWLISKSFKGFEMGLGNGREFYMEKGAFRSLLDGKWVLAIE